MSSRFARTVVCLLPAACAALAGCGGGSSAAHQPVPASISAVSGASQAGTVAAQLPEPLVVLVRGDDGQPMAGVVVHWAVASGGGSVSAATSTTTSSGQASTTVTVGAVAGPNLFSATVSGVASGVPFPETGTAGPAARIARVSGDAQSAVRGATLGAPLVVRVEDEHQNPVAGTTVTWSVTSGGGSVQPATSLTAADGTASATATLGVPTAANAFAATVSGLAGSPIAFAATGTHGAASRLVVVSGAGQAGTAGAALGLPLVVQVRDANDVAVPGAAVDWAATVGTGTVSAATTVSDPDGAVSVVATLGIHAGPNAFTASPSGFAADPVTFPATGVPGPAANLVRASPADGPFTAGSSVVLAVRATDANGNGVQGTTIAWASTGGAGSVTPSSSTTDAVGQATATASLAVRDGANGFTATAAGLAGSPVTFQLTGTSGPAAALVRSAPLDDGNYFAGSSQTLAVRVQDANGNPVAGTTVAWSVASGGGSVAPGATLTDPGGVATTTATLDVASGGNAFAAAVAGLAGSPVTFTLAGLPSYSARLVRISPADGTFPAGSAQTLIVQLLDGAGNPIAGHTLYWTVTSGAGTLSLPYGLSYGITDASGRSTATATLAASPSPNAFAATYGTAVGSPVVFRLEGN